jgi:ABC-type Fe3+ transport system substrate-binding protein
MLAIDDCQRCRSTPECAQYSDNLSREDSMASLLRGLVFAAAAAASASVNVHAAFGADASLIAAAKAEGQVVWYTSFVVDSLVRPMADAFEKTYGIKVNYVRSDQTEMVLRLINESHAGKVQADVFDGIGNEPAARRAGLVLKWQPDIVHSLPQQYFDADGYWTATNFYAMTPGYNTDLVPRGTEPRTLQDLLDPKWKGKMVWSSNPTATSAPGFIGLVLTDMGEDKGMAYLRALAKQDITGVKASGRQVMDEVVSGEYPLALHIFNNHPGISAAQGAHVDWIPMNPAFSLMQVAGVTAGAPHPNAGKLLVDFILSDAGQRILRDGDYLPVANDVAPKNPALKPDGTKFRAIYLTQDQLDAAMPKWVKVFGDLFR